MGLSRANVTAAFIPEVTGAKDKERAVGVVDLSKAFEKGCHREMVTGEI